ncbi:hypothetical protein [Halosimplex pelagicum]|uniref:Uncharacterized protein n=1 Tax=Halosimplex pelagicum TaxID=869886 RepID=A0A7D5P773_9EURY|nr:hypothetical protein [Halosimplex pelagicum]QLH82430.1 hypothetical protein HZS54_12745 [Halosimplex pelagicum]QLH82486.1 hypothetical protein HZS54_13050 [Halosimplex pelagicum]
MAYAKVGRYRHDLGPGFSPLLYAYDQLTSEGLMIVIETDGGKELVWRWPEGTTDIQGDGPIRETVRTVMGDD